MLKLLLIICVANTLTVLCAVTPPASLDIVDKALQKLWLSNDAFTQKFLRLKMEFKPDESFIASPSSMLLPLSQLVLYAKGSSLKQLSEILKFDDMDEIRLAVRRLLDNFNLPKNVTLLLAQKVYGNTRNEFSENFLYDSEIYFNSTARSLDFGQSEKSAKIVNDWVNEHTNGLVPNLVKPYMLTPLTELLLVNAMYFKGNWLSPFNPKNTAPENFYMASGEKKLVDMMNQESTFRYLENPTLQVKAVELPYKDNNFNLVCILPTYNNTNSLYDVYKTLQDPKMLGKLLNNMSQVLVQIKLPSLKTSSEIDYVEILRDLNVTDIFDHLNNDMRGLQKKSDPLFVSHMLQKSAVVINELGSEAAVANVIELIKSSWSSSPPKTFVANRPFLYFILYKRNILFCGAYTGT